MNLHQIVSGAIGAINPFIEGTISVSTGYTKAADYSQVPAYAAPIAVSMQVQQMTTQELAHTDGLGIQGDLRKVWLNGNYDGVVRPSGKGGDLMTFGGQNWLIVLVLETWPDWCSVVVQLQQ